MERQSGDVTLVPSFLRGGWNLVNLGRWVGIFILLSAVVLGVLEIYGLVQDIQLPLHYLARIFWRNLITTGSFGVIIILLAEVLARMSGWEYDHAASAADDAEEDEG